MSDNIHASSPSFPFSSWAPLEVALSCQLRTFATAEIRYRSRGAMDSELLYCVIGCSKPVRLQRTPCNLYPRRSLKIELVPKTFANTVKGLDLAPISHTTIILKEAELDGVNSPT